MSRAIVTADSGRGRVLTATAGRWSPRHSRTQVQWFADGRRIARATGTTYTARKADPARGLGVKVTATSQGRHTSTFSAATTPVVAG